MNPRFSALRQLAGLCPGCGCLGAKSLVGFSPVSVRGLQAGCLCS